MAALRLLPAVFGMMAFTPAWAQTDPDRDLLLETCESSDVYAARVQACNQYIASGDLPREGLVQAIANRGLAHFLAGNRTFAQGDFEAVLTIDPQSAAGWVGRGLLLEINGDIDGAVAAYDRATTFNARLSAPYLRRGDILLARRDFPGVVTEMNRLFAVTPQHIEGLLRRGLAKARLGQLDDAMADLEAALEGAPDDPEIVRTRGMIHAERGDDIRAFVDYDRAVRLSPDDVRNLDLRGAALVRLKRYPDAIADFNAIIGIEPGTAWAHGSLCWARALWEQQLDVAVANCTEAIRLSPQTPNFFGSRAMAHLKRGDLPAARSDFEQTLILNPNSHYARYGRGVVLIRQGREVDGRAEVAAALVGDAKMAETYAGYGVTAP